MLSQIRRWLRRRCSRPTAHTTTRPLEVTHLEDRSLPSVAIDPAGSQATASLCACMMCCGGGPASDAYRFSNGSSSTAGAAKWSQPGGLGSQVTVTYSFHSSVTAGLTGVSYAQIRAATQEALAEWAQYAPLRFVEVADSGPSFLTGTNYTSGSGPTIRIGARAQDGAYGTLAYAYYPSTSGLGGDVVLDSGETWGTGPGGGRIDLTEILTHELGHAIGLGHEPTATAIMNPTYGSRFAGPGTAFLYADDITGIQALYGGGVGAVVPLGSGGSGDSSRFVVSNGWLVVNGTAGNDSFVFQAGTTSHSVMLNGVSYVVDPAMIGQVVFAGGAGTDSVLAFGSAGSEQLLLTSAQLTFSGLGFSLSATGAEAVTVYGGGGADVGWFADTVGNDLVGLGSSFASLAGTNATWQLYGFGQLSTSATAGGTDSVFLYDTVGDDTFLGAAGSAVLQGSGYYVGGYGYEVAQVNGGRGGSDVATLLDSAGNDTLTYLNGLAWLQLSSGQRVQSYLFGPTYAYSTAGGTDAAWLYGTTGNDTYAASPVLSSLTTVYGVVAAVGFRNSYGVANGGTDAMYLYGSAGADTLHDTATYTRLTVGLQSLHGYNFDTVVVYGQGGGDTAALYDSAGNDALSQSAGEVRLARGVGATSVVFGFATGSVYATAGGLDVATLAGTANNDLFAANGGIGTLSAGGSLWSLSAFDLIHLLNGGGSDTIQRIAAPTYTLTTSNWVG